MRSVSQTGISHRVPASTVFPPRELKHYRRWQRLYSDLKPVEQGYVPTAVEYDDFQSWLRRQDSGYFSDVFDDVAEYLEPLTNDTAPPVAAICRHPMHPVAARHKRPRCAVCTVDIHISYMEILQQALKSAGGRAPSCTLTASEHQENAYNAWLLGKISTLKELSELERLADEEAEWSAQHPDVILNDIKSAKQALELYWSEVNGVCQSTTSSPTKKTVAFAQDTTFEPGRPSAYFWRRSPRYEPGRHTIVERLEGYEDIVSEDSENYCSPGSAYPHIVDDSSILDASYGTDRLLPSQQALDGIEDDDGDSDWEDVDIGDPESDIVDCGYVWDDFEAQTSFVVFTND